MLRELYSIIHNKRFVNKKTEEGRRGGKLFLK